MLHLHLPFIADGGHLVDLAKYIAICITDGDWANDWLTHLPVAIRPAVETIGQWIALAVGA
jgi:hypothetical protein